MKLLYLKFKEVMNLRELLWASYVKSNFSICLKVMVGTSLKTKYIEAFQELLPSAGLSHRKVLIEVLTIRRRVNE
ncbi:MAG: hypothetical protein RIC80_19105 [Cyclobacteriaceae bacterium]